MAKKTMFQNLRDIFIEEAPARADTESLAVQPDTEVQQVGKRIQIERVTLYRNAPDIGNWRNALVMAESVRNPDRRSLYGVYKEVVLDPHLYAVTQRIILRCTNNPINFYQDGNVIDGPVQDLTRQAWFFDLVRYIVESRWWGHSLIQLNFLESGYRPEMTSGIDLVHRANVRPEYGDIMPMPGETTNTIPYRKPPYNNFLLEVGNTTDLGMLNIATPHILYKRYGVKDWSEFLEVYGMPIREIEYDPNLSGSEDAARKALGDQGSNSGVIVPRGSLFKLHDTAKAGNSDAFNTAMVFHNKEISKLFLLQTMTTEDGSSLSQSEIHQKAEDEAIMGYRMFVESVLNSQLIPLLQRHGYPIPEGARFDYDDRERLSKAQMADLLIKLQNIADIPMSYIYETFGIPEPGKGDKIKNNVASSSQMPDIGQKKNLSLPEYKGPDYLQLALEEGALTAQEERLLRDIFTDQLRTGRIDRKYLFALADQLIGGVADGYGALPEDWNEPDHLYRSLLEANVQRFSAAKTLALTQQLNELKNSARDFSDFKLQAGPLLGNYNINWMRAEYNHAVATAQNAAAWIRQSRVADEYPMWEYQTVGDDRVRASHASLDGLRFRYDDPDAARIYPPNGFGCRCEGVPMKADGKQAATLEDAIGLLGEDWGRMTEKGFDTNPGATGAIFQRSMEYLQAWNPNALTLQAYGLQAFRSMRTKGTLTPKNLSKAAANKWFKERKGAYGLDSAEAVRALDYRSRAVTVNRALADSLEAAGASNLLSILPDLLTDPDEVWLQENNGGLLRIMVKFFAGRAVIGGVSFGLAQPETLASLLITDNPDTVRSGILALVKQ